MDRSICSGIWNKSYRTNIEGKDANIVIQCCETFQHFTVFGSSEVFMSLEKAPTSRCVKQRFICNRYQPHPLRTTDAPIGTNYLRTVGDDAIGTNFKLFQRMQMRTLLMNSHTLHRNVEVNP